MAAAAKTPHNQLDRPTSITVFGIIYIVFGVLMVLTVVAVVAFTTMIDSYSSTISGMMGNTMTAFGGTIAVGVGILTAIEFAISWALFSGKSIGRIIVIVLTMVDFIIHCATLLVGNVFAIPHIILDLITFVYMWKSNVVSYFNKELLPLR